MNLWNKLFGNKENKEEQNTSEPTIVDLRHTYGPVKYWTAVVQYDAWKRPFATNKWGDPMALELNGSCSSPFTDWKLKSGPPVVFTKDDMSKSFFPPKDFGNNVKDPS